MANSVYSKLGAQPAQIDVENSIPPYLSSFSNFEPWFYNQEWERVWTAFDRLVSNTSFIKRLSKERADSIINFIQQYAEKNQDPDGLWGWGQAQEVRFSGAAKYGTFCNNLNLVMPNADKMYATILNWFETNRELDFSEHSACPICVPRNALKALYYIKPHLSFEIPENDKNLLIQKTFEMLRFYSNTDGGFMKHYNESKIAPLDLNLGEYPTLVSDMNGTQLAVTARISLYDLIELDVPVLESKNVLEFAKN